MTTSAIKMPGALFALALFALALPGLTLLGTQTAAADPMKCSGEEKTCATACRKAATMAVSTCLTACGVRLSACVKTGCWDNGAQRYCGLAKR